MLSYQHAYHAGNLADVHKHGLLAWMLGYLIGELGTGEYLGGLVERTDLPGRKIFRWMLAMPLAIPFALLSVFRYLSFRYRYDPNEMVIRTALGARRGGLLGLVLGRAFRVVAAGALAGLLASWWATLLLQALLADVAPRDPASFAGALVILFAVTALAALIPAHRATRADPVAALRG